MMTKLNSYKEGPDENGHFSLYGGRYVAETLMPLIIEVEKAYNKLKQNDAFHTELHHYLKTFVGRPSPLYFAERLTKELNGAKIYFKREDLNHTGAHKVNNCMGQILLARKMGKRKIIAETGAGMHGVATATVCALFDVPCTIYMGSKDIERQSQNVSRMKMLGAEIIAVTSGAGTLKDAMNEALRHWVSSVETTYYLIGTVAGPHPYPMMVRDFQAIIGEETKEQVSEIEGKLPDSLIACIGGGSNAIGLFYPFLDDNINMIAVEAAGQGLTTKKHAASVSGGSVGILHGNRSLFLQNEDGQILDAHSISAGLDYPGIGPEHAWLRDVERVKYESVTDAEAVKAFAS